jgi:hypothetical protein
MCFPFKPVTYTILKITADYHLNLAICADWVRSDCGAGFSGTEISWEGIVV